MIEKRLNYSDLQKSVKESWGANFIETKMMTKKIVGIMRFHLQVQQWLNA